MDSSQAYSTETIQIQLTLENILLKVLKSSEHILPTQLSNSLRNKVESITTDKISVVCGLQYFLFALLSHIQSIQQSKEINISTEDYQILQNSIQKSQAQIRKHIRIEQQLKIYMDGLEEKIEQLQKQQTIEEHKYLQLYESTKSIDHERKELRTQLTKLEDKLKMVQEKEKIRIKSKAYKIMSQTSFAHDEMTHHQSKIKVSNSHNKTKIDEKNRKISSKRNSKLRFLEGSINVSLLDREKVNKNQPQIAQNKAMKDSNNLDNELRCTSSNKLEITKTVQMKECYKKPIRRINKHRTEGPYISHNEARSNSVCN